MSTTSRIFDCPLIELETEEDDLVSATVKQIWYRKPMTGEKGVWTATRSGTKLTYQVTDEEADESGRWILNAYYVIGGLEFTGKDFVWTVSPVVSRPD